MVDHRSSFEVWVAKVWRVQERDLNRNGMGYVHWTIDAAWEGWRAGIEYGIREANKSNKSSSQDRRSPYEDMEIIHVPVKDGPTRPLNTDFRKTPEIVASEYVDTHSYDVYEAPVIQGAEHAEGEEVIRHIYSIPSTPLGIVLEPRETTTEQTEDRFGKEGGTVIAQVPDEPNSSAETVVDEAKPRRGRPPGAKPWEAEGISRITWYRRQGVNTVKED